MNWRMITAVLLLGLLLGIGSSLAFKDSIQPPPPPVVAAPAQPPVPKLPAPDLDVPPSDPTTPGEPLPPLAMPATSPDYPPLSAPPGALPPLPPPVAPGVDLAIPSPATDVAPPPPPKPAQDLAPPRGYEKIEQSIRKIAGVSSMAWGQSKILYILVRNAPPATVAASACSRASAIAKGVRVHVQSMTHPDTKPVERRC